MCFKVFYKSRLRVTMFMLMVIGIVMYNMCVLSFKDVNLKVGPLNAFVYQEQSAYYLFLVMLFLSFDYYREYVEATVLERITTSGERMKFTLRLLLNTVCVVALYSVIVWGCIICFWNYSGSLNMETCLYITQNVFLFFFMTGILACCLSLCVSYYTNRMWGYVVLFVSALFFGPLVDYSLQILSGLFGKGTSLIYVFNIFPGASKIINPFVIITGNVTTFAKSLVWITLLLFFIMIRVGYKRIMPIMTVVGLFAISAMVVIKPDYSYNNSTPINRMNSIFCNSEYYSEDHPNYNEAAGFKVLSYDMKMQITSMLYADVMICIEDNSLSEYRFTLQHMYKVDEVFDSDGNRLRYERTGDYLIIKTDKPLNRIKIKYHGGNPEFYSSYSQLFLPGFFPYYPIAGYHSIFDSARFKYIDNSYGYPVMFHVKIESSSKVYSNLDQDDEGFFYGNSICPMFISGFVEDKTINGISCINQYLAKENNNEALYMGYFIDYVTNSMQNENYKKIIFMPSSGFSYPSVDDGNVLITNDIWVSLAYNYNANNNFIMKSKDIDVSEEMRTERFKWAYYINQLDSQGGYELYYSFYKRFMLDNSEESEKNFEEFFKRIIGIDEWEKMER